MTTSGPPGSTRSSSGVPGDRRSRSTGSHHTAPATAKPADRGQSIADVGQQQTAGSVRYHHEPESSAGRSRRHRSTEDEGHAVGGRAGSSVSGTAADRSRSASGANSGSVAVSSAVGGPRPSGGDRGTRSYGGSNGISDVPVGTRHAQQR